MKINGFGMSRTHETLRKDQDKQPKEKNSTTKPQDKTDTYSISPEARARMGAESQGTNPYGRNVTEETPQDENHTATVLPTESSPTTLPNHGETLMQELKLETAVEGDNAYISRKQIEAYSAGVEKSELLTSNPNYDLYGVLGPKQDIAGSYTGDYANNSWETTFPPHNPPQWTNTVEGFDNFMAYNQSVRDDISDSISKLLKDNNVVIPEGVEFDISVDPYDFKIHATGVNGETLDPELERQIEDALNKGDNGKNLYQHIQHVNTTIHLYDPDTIQETVEFRPSELNPQLTAWEKEHNESYDKWNVMAFMSHYSGCDFDELEYRDGAWYNADGENAWTKATSSFLESVPSGEKLAAVMALSGMTNAYQNLVEKGFDNVEDRNMTITYSGGALYDYGSAQGIGEGQTDWIEDVRDEIGKNVEALAEYNTLVDARMAELEANKPQPYFREFTQDELDGIAKGIFPNDLMDAPSTGDNPLADKLREILNGTANQYSLLDSLFPNKS